MSNGTPSTSATLSFDCSDDELYSGFKNSASIVTPKSVLSALHRSGISTHDPRLRELYANLKQHDSESVISKLDLLEAGKHSLTILHQVASKELVISDFASFSTHIQAIHDIVEPDTGGNNADYIPVLRDADPDQFGVAFCSVDGQFFEIGDTRTMYSVQSTSKPLTFAAALEKLTTEKVLKWVGNEPSGRPFNDTTFLTDTRPFNPMVNAGALMTAATLASGYPDLLARDGPKGTDGTYGAELWEEILKPLWAALTGDGVFGDIGFSEETFLSERRTADNNIGIAYLLKAHKGLPDGVGTDTMVDLYLRACSTTTNAAGMAVMAATLANGGRNPFTGRQVLSVDHVKKTLSVMTLCGFYDNTGQFFFDTGLPSKSGVSGCVFLVIPNVGGFAIFSPRLDSYGNSVRGSKFSTKLVELFTFHSFDSLSSNATGCKLDPRFSCDFSAHRRLERMRWALRAGDVETKKFDDFLVATCLRVAHVDGDVDDSEISEIRTVYTSIMDALLEKERVEKISKMIGCKEGEEAKKDLVDSVHENARRLDDTQKELVLEGAFKVSTADGKVTDKEQQLLKTLAMELNVPDIVIDIKLMKWKSQMKCHD